MKIGLLFALFAVAAAAPKLRQDKALPPVQNDLEGQEAELSIIELLQEIGATSLVDVLKKTGLAETLSGPGPFTLFAPSNEAFERLLPDVASNLTSLKYVLEFHGVSGIYYSSQVYNDALLDSLLPTKKIRFNIYDHHGPAARPPMITVEGAPVNLSLSNQNATNGVVHVIEKIIYPPIGTFTGFLSSPYAKNFSSLFNAVKAAGLADLLDGPGPFTVFAPTDAAFSHVPKEVLDNLLKDKKKIAKVLEYHVLGSTQWSFGLFNREVVKTLENSTLGLNAFDRPGHIPHIQIIYGKKHELAHVIYPDIAADNGCMHLIDTVMLPPDL